MNEFLSTLLQAVIIAAVPICAGAAVQGVRAAVQYLASKSESEIAKKYLMDVADAISTAVTYTSQTYVDALKKGGIFDKEAQLEALPRKDIARRSIADNGKIIVTDSLDKAVEAANRIAPEHLELCVDEPFALLPRIKNAGSVFLGRSTPEALGDYFAGPNHTLPTSGTARFSSPLGVDDFMKRSSFLSYDQAALNACGDRIADFARREGLEGHARSAESRKKSE